MNAQVSVTPKRAQGCGRTRRQVLGTAACAVLGASLVEAAPIPKKEPTAADWAAAGITWHTPTTEFVEMILSPGSEVAFTDTSTVMASKGFRGCYFVLLAAREAARWGVVVGREVRHRLNLTDDMPLLTEQLPEVLAWTRQTCTVPADDAMALAELEKVMAFGFARWKRPGFKPFAPQEVEDQARLEFVAGFLGGVFNHDTVPIALEGRKPVLGAVVEARV